MGALYERPSPGPYGYVSITPATLMASNKSKARLTDQSEKIIGVVDPALRYMSDQGPDTGFTISTFDTTTHTDRAVFRLYNSSGGSRKLYGIAITGKPVVQIAGQGGWLWEHSDWDDIDTNGEKFEEVSNKFIIDPLQAEDLGDYYWKLFSPHKQYSIMISGAHPEIEPGSIWTLTISYILNNNTIEDINTDVQVTAVTVNRPVGTIGETAITCIIYDGAWSKTNSTRTRQVGAGRPQWLQNRANTLVVASADYIGQADYYCDGTDDDVEIQDAINRIGSIGGGQIELTNGDFNCSSAIEVSVDNIVIGGYGHSTKIIISNAVTENYAVRVTGSDVTLTTFAIFGDGSAIAHDFDALTLTLPYTTTKCLIENILIDTITTSGASNEAIGIGCTAGGYSDIVGCFIQNINSGSYIAYGIYGVDRAYGCSINNITASTNARGIVSSNRCMLNRVGTLTGSTTTKYYLSYADSSSTLAYECADTPDGGFNS